MTPNIFLAFSNSEQARLTNLSKEDELIYGILLEDSKENGYDIIRESFATPEVINQRFAEWGNEIAVFHFSGHAGNHALLIDDRAINATGLAYHLEQSARNGILKLVVLNGCSTVGQVKLLLKLGVPAVIATNASVDDVAAKEFSTWFYRNLARGSMDIKAAFLNALVYAQNVTIGQLDLKNKEARGISFLNERDPNEPLWEVFFCRDGDVSLNPLPKVRPVVNGSFEANTLLRDAIYHAMVKAKNEKFSVMETQIRNMMTVEERDIEDESVKALPLPIGEHLRKLFCPSDEGDLNGYDKVNVRRLEQICRLYATTMELLSCIVICLIWEVKGSERLPDEVAQPLREHFALSGEERSVFAYAEFLRKILAFWMGQPVDKQFLSELSEIYRLLTVKGDVDDDNFLSACEFLEVLRQRIANGSPIRVDEIPNLCADAEGWLARIMGALGFLYEYHLTSVQAISILKHRFNPRPSFSHSVVKLTRVNGSAKYIYELNECLSCQGVVLMKGKMLVKEGGNKILVAGDDDLKFLNLSPFIFDALAFDSVGKSKIVILNEYQEQKDCYQFKDICKPDSVIDFEFVENRNRFSTVKMELEHYRTDMLGINKNDND
ncbi:hypothetical protein DBR43_30100 [Pedobacter sp. KBW06]|uniref:CHAT domain-containing protein n=1 Tax=Pedobacter sp. KBW06 TaxID=2153359 RepID=UPI000F59BA73|nr:CHAT domain-containing protein [Pedobacter sp. KBW06]RQO66462.1 hypothetical protein DBR43_30100 [Pedobacter sp. KBW06]